MTLCQRLGLAGGWLISAALIIYLFLLAPGATLAQEPAVPQAPPDAEQGLEIFARRCANCHGPQGGGNGELAASLPAPPTAFSARGYRQTAVPTALFDAISHGRIDRGMPPFGPESSDPLTEAERWDLVAAIYSLSTPGDSVALGQALYEERVAANVATAPVDLTALDYWFTRSNAAVLDELESAGLLAADALLGEEERQAIIDYARTFSYQYVDLAAPVEPIEAATISGQVINGTTGEAAAGLTAVLRGFTPELEESVTMTATTGADGRYSFELSQAPPDLIYITSVNYEGISFNSSVDQLSRSEPALELPLMVYETTTDPASVHIEQLHVVLNFVNNHLQVTELYVFSNDKTAVFIGETGNQGEGTVAIMLPASAENVIFQRSFGALESFVQAPEVIQTETGWADTVPLHPGRGSLTLLVRYELPYHDGMRLAHPLAYEVNSASAILPDAGVTLSGDGWVSQGVQTLPGGTYVSYSRPGLAAGEAVTLTLDGRPRRVVDERGNVLLVRNETAELMAGSVALLFVLAAAAYTVRTWQARSAAPVVDGNAGPLLQAIVALDDAYENGAINQDEYVSQRQKLKSDLIAIWDSNRDWRMEIGD